MRWLAALPLALAAFPATAGEGCFGPGTALFHCTTGGGAKALDLCLQDDVVLYRFGPVAGPAELLLGRTVRVADYTPWNGVGRDLWETLAVSNGPITYLVFWSLDRLVPDPDVQGGVEVQQGDTTLARVQCDAQSVTIADFEPLYDAKEQLGLTWCPETMLWAQSCD